MHLFYTEKKNPETKHDNRKLHCLGITLCILCKFSADDILKYAMSVLYSAEKKKKNKKEKIINLAYAEFAL